ncbi:hypothetical protein PO909_000436 [Leuciscus waleckii]
MTDNKELMHVFLSMFFMFQCLHHHHHHHHHLHPHLHPQTEISQGRSVTLSCQLYSDAGLYCDYLVSSEGFELLWVNQAGVDLKTDSRYQILSSSDQYRCIIINLTTTLLNEDNNREWRCQLTRRNQVKTSVRYTVKYSGEKTVLEDPHNVSNTKVYQYH